MKKTIPCPNACGLRSVEAFERSRIQSLSEVRAAQQKGLFTKWINAQLERDCEENALLPVFHYNRRGGRQAGDFWETSLSPNWRRSVIIEPVTDLYRDLSDGRVLLKLLEIYTGKRLDTTRGNMRAHFMENVSKALAVLKEQNIHLENIGASDIVDGNANLILGLIWTIMLHFQVQNMLIQPSANPRSTADIRNALLRWCQLRTAVYPQVHVHNFTTDWTDGLSICALLHRHRPDLLDFNTLLSESPLSRITTAFTVAASRLRIPVLVEPREFIACCCCRDERCVIAVIATWYQFLNQDRATKKSGDRLSAVLARALDVNRKLAAYLCRVARAKAWLKKNQEFLNRQTEILTSPRQRNVHAGADDSLRRLRQWYAEEKRPQIDNMNQIEDTWLTLRTEQMASGYRQLMPPQGYSIADLQAAWHQIDTAEGTLRVLIQETLRERAYKERLLATFNRKVGLHRRWLAENAKLALVLCMADRTNLTCTLQRLTSLSNWGADSNILSFLLSEREKLLALQCKHKTMLADADAHNGQRIRGLQELRRQICQLDAEGGQTEESLSRLRRSWTNLTTVLSRRTEFIESSLGMVESIIDVEKVIMQLETSWDRLAERLLRAVDFELQLTEGEKLTLDRMTSGSWQRVGAALRSALSDGTLPPVLPCSVRQKLFTRFLALTLPMESLLSFCECHCRNLNDLKQRASTLTDRVQRTAEQRQYLQALTRMTEITFGELQNDNLESIRIISSKFRLIENEIHSQVGKETAFGDCPFCTKVAPENRHPAPLLASQTAKEGFESTQFDENIRWIRNWRVRRPLSLETLTNIVGQENAKLRRTMTLERLHEPCVLPEEVSRKQTFLRRMKQLAADSLNRCRRSFHETHLLLMTETAAFLREIEQYKAFKSVFLELTEVRIELDEGKAWVCQTTDYFSQTQLPAFRLALVKCDGSPSDGSLEAAGDIIGWWKRLLQTNKLLKTIILYQSTIRRHQQILQQTEELKRGLQNWRAKLLRLLGQKNVTQLRSTPASPESHERTEQKPQRCRSLSAMGSNPHSSTGLPSVPFLHVCEKDEWFRLTPELHETVSANDTVRRMTVELLKRIRQLNTEVHAVAVSTIHRKKQMQQELDNLYSLQTSGFLLEWIHINLETLKNLPSPFDCNLRKSAESETSGGHVNNIVSAGLESAEQFIITFMKEMERRTQQELPALKCLDSVSNSDSILDLVDEERSAHGETNFWNHLLEFAYDKWNELVILSSNKQHSIQMAERFCRLEAEHENCLRWVKVKQELLLTTGNDVTDVREVIRMECRMSGWENDLKALTGSVDSCLEELNSLREALSQAVQAGSEGNDGLKAARRAVEEWKCELQRRWQDFMLLLEEHKKKLDMSLALQNVLQEAEEMNLWLRDKQKTIAALEIPITISDIDDQTSIYQNLLKDLEHTEGKISSIQNETYQILILRDIDQLNASLSRKESQIARTDYLPNLEHISRQVKLQTEVLTSIRAMSTSISQSLTAAAEAKMQDRIRPKAENLRSRYRQVETKAEGVLASLQFHLLEKEKHQQLESMEEWISERQAVVNAQFVITGTSVKQQKAIQKYHLLRNFEAEVDSYSHLAERIFREAEDVIKLDPANSTSLAQALERNADLWANLKITLSSQGSKLVKIYRAIIFSEGCEELVEWLRKASLKIFSIEPNRHLGQRTTAFGLLIDLNREPRQGAQSYLRSRLTAGLKRSSSDTCVNFLPEKPLDQCGKYDLSNISYALSKVADLNGQLNNKWLFFQELQEHFQHFLHDESNFTENESQLAFVRSKFTGIQLKIKACLVDLSAQKCVVDALRMLAGETDWLEERRGHIKWELVGSSLAETERLLLRHRNFAKEVEIRKLRSRPIIAKVLLWMRLAESQNRSTDLQERSEDMECAVLLSDSPHLLVELMDRVSRLLWMQCMVETRLNSQDDTLEHWRSFFSHQMDLIETHNWLAETESAVMTESHASSGVASARAAITKHSFLEYTVSSLQASSIRSLGQKTSQLLADISRRISINKERLSTWKRVSQGLPAESGQFEAAKRRRHQLRRRIHALERSATKLTASQQSLQKQFTDLLNLVLEKKHRLRELLALNRLYDDVADLEEWMDSQTREALLCQTGRDLEECARLQQQFVQLQWRVLGPQAEVTGQLVEASFDRRPELRLDQSAACLELAATGDLPPLPDGPEKLLRAVQTCRHLIALRHSDSPRIALWQGRLAEDWQGLRELLDTRAELLRAAGNHLLLLRRCESVTEDLLDKLNAFPSTIGTDAETLARQQWQLASFQQDILAMNERVSWVLTATEVLLPQYAGEHAQEIKLKRQRMLDAWQRLNETLEQHRRLLREASALDKWLADWAHFLNWTIFTRKTLEDAMTLQNCRVGLPEQECNAGLATTKEISREKLDHLELWREILARKESLTCLLQDGCRLREWIRSELKDGGEMAKTALSSLESLIWNSARFIEEDVNFPLYSTSPETVKSLPSPNPLTVRKTAVECLLQRSAAATHAMECEMSLLLAEFFFVKCLWKKRMADLTSRMKRAEVLRQIRSLEVWMNNMEKVLQTNDLGSDLYETLNLSDEHQKFCGAVSFQEERIQRLAQMDILQTEDDSRDWLEDIHSEFSELLQEHNLWRRSPSPTAVVEEDAQMDLQPREDQRVLFERKEGILYGRYLGKRSNSHSSARKWRKQFVVLNPDTLSLQFLDLPEICETRRENRVKRQQHCEFLLSDGLSAIPVETKTHRRGYAFMLHVQRRSESYLLKAASKEIMADWVSTINRAARMVAETVWTDAIAVQENELVKCDACPSRPATSRRWRSRQSRRRLITQTSCLPFGSFWRNRQFTSPNLSADEEDVKREDGEGEDASAEADGRRDLRLRSLLKVGQTTMLSPLSDTAQASWTIMTLTLPLRAIRRRIRRYSLDRGASVTKQLSQTTIPSRPALGLLLADSAQSGSMEDGEDFQYQGQQRRTDSDDDDDDDDDNDNDDETDIDLIDEFS